MTRRAFAHSVAALVAAPVGAALGDRWWLCRTTTGRGPFIDASELNIRLVCSLFEVDPALIRFDRYVGLTIAPARYANCQEQQQQFYDKMLRPTIKAARALRSVRPVA